MHFLLTALGSYGDVHPFVGLGKTLAARGHEVAIVANPYYDSLIADAKLKHIHLGDQDDFDRLKDMPEIWHPIKGPRLIFREAIARFVRPLYDIVAEKYRSGETVVAAHGLDFGTIVAHEKLGVPFASVELAPLAIRSVDAPPKVPVLPQAAPGFLWRTLYWITDKIVVDPIICPAVNALRSDLGLGPPIRRVLKDYWYSSQLVLCLWPDWFGPTQPDWPANCHTVGFPLWDASDQSELADGVQGFLAAGEAPIVFTPGSFNAFGKEFFAAAVEVCVALNRRGILLSKFDDQIPNDLPKNVRHFSFVPLRKLLAHSAAFVHHGGVGSSSQGLEAGIPQIVMPLAFDQPDNGQRLVDLGVAEVLPPKKFRGPAVAAALTRLLSNDTCLENCRHIAHRCDGIQALSRAAELLEQLGEQHVVARKSA